MFNRRGFDCYFFFIIISNGNDSLHKYSLQNDRCMFKPLEKGMEVMH